MLYRWFHRASTKRPEHGCGLDHFRIATHVQRVQTHNAINPFTTLSAREVSSWHLLTVTVTVTVTVTALRATALEGTPEIIGRRRS